MRGPSAIGQPRPTRQSWSLTSHRGQPSRRLEGRPCDLPMASRAITSRPEVFARHVSRETRANEQNPAQRPCEHVLPASVPDRSRFSASSLQGHPRPCLGRIGDIAPRSEREPHPAGNVHREIDNRPDSTDGSDHHRRPSSASLPCRRQSTNDSSHGSTLSRRTAASIQASGAKPQAAWIESPVAPCLCVRGWRLGDRTRSLHGCRQVAYGPGVDTHHQLL